MSLSLINDCLSDNDNLSVIGCNALVVMLELPPNCTLCAHETFLKFESVPRLCRIISTNNQDPVSTFFLLINKNFQNLDTFQAENIDHGIQRI